MNERAVGAGAGLFSFLLLVKVCLLSWSMLYTANRPLADLPPDGVLYLAGADLLLCFAIAANLAALFHAEEWLARRYGRRMPRIGGLFGGLLLAAIVIFSVASFEVARIYGGPLDIQLLRAADDLNVFRSSMWAYVSALPVLLLIYGLAIVPLLSRVVTGWLIERRRLRDPRHLWAVIGAICLGTVSLEYVRLHRVETFGVKENAVVHFVRHYKPPFRPIDTRKAMAQLEQTFGAELLRRTELPASLTNPGRMMHRDFAWPASAAADAGGEFNVIVIQMESTAALHVDRETAPNLMSLADRGLSFHRHVTTVTQTAPATYSLYYSDYLPDLGTRLRLVYGSRGLTPTSLAEVFHRAGYRTGVFHTGFLDYCELRYLFQDKGMEKVVGAKEMALAGAPLAYSAGVHEERTVDEISAWIRANKHERFFATYLTEFPHHPYLTMANDPPFPNDTWLNRYRNSLHYADAAVGRLIEVLNSEQLLEKTIIAVVGDHGETVSHYPVGHGLRVSVEELRTPFILSNPRLFPNAIESRMNSDHLDVAPTVAGLAGLTPPSEWLGRNLLADKVFDRLHFVTVTHIRRTAIVDGELVYVLNRGNGKSSLYEMGSTELAPLLPSDPRQAMIGRYNDEARLFAGWSAWRHLVRVDELMSPNDDGARPVQAASYTAGRSSP